MKSKIYVYASRFFPKGTLNIVPNDPHGLGTFESPYLIITEAQLLSLAAGLFVNNFTAYYRLEKDIALTTSPWIPIGGNGKDAFSGVFDGNGYKITNMVITQNNIEYSGLFGQSSGTIKNLGVNGIISNITTGGILVGYNTGIIHQCYSTGSVSSSKSECVLGGLVGNNSSYSNSVIENSYSKASLTSTASNGEVGALIGRFGYGSVRRCFASGVVNGSGCYYGGLIGRIYSAGTLISNNSNTLTC